MTPRLTLLLSSLGAAFVLAGGIYWKGRQAGLASERPKTEAARAQAAVASLEVQGARDSARRVELVIRQRDMAAQVAADLTPQALNAEDADAPLDPDRADRLRAADRQLCDAAPALAGCSPGGDAR